MAAGGKCGKCGHPATAHTSSRIINLKSMLLTCARMIEKSPGAWERCGCQMMDGTCEFCEHPVASHLRASSENWRVCAFQNGREIASPSPCGCMI